MSEREVLRKTVLDWPCGSSHPVIDPLVQDMPACDVANTQVCLAFLYTITGTHLATRTFCNDVGELRQSQLETRNALPPNERRTKRRVLCWLRVSCQRHVHRSGLILHCLGLFFGDRLASSSCDRPVFVGGADHGCHHRSCALA